MSLRRIAHRLEYSPAAVYTYFRGKDEILRELADADADRLQARLNEVVRRTSDPLERVRQVLRTLYGCATRNPLLLESWTRETFSGAGTVSPGHDFRGVVAAIETDLQTRVAHGELSVRGSVHATCGMLWLGVLGAARVAPRLASGDLTGDVLAAEFLDALVAGLIHRRPGAATGCDRPTPAGPPA